MDPILQAACKRANKAAKRGDIRAVDEIEFEYIKRTFRLFSRRADAMVPAECIRLCRGAGPRGESRIEWALPSGERVYSDMDANVLPEYDDDACSALVSMHPGLAFDLDAA
jgi:hypothetical protein